MFMGGPRNWFHEMNSASLCSLAGRYNNPITPWFLAPIAFLKISAEYTCMIYACQSSVHVTKTCTPSFILLWTQQYSLFLRFIAFCFRQTPRLSSQVFLSLAILKSALNSFRCCIELCVCPCRKLQQSCTSCFNVTTWHVWSQTHTSSILKVYNMKQSL